MGSTCVGTEHILLGLLREEDGVAARVLQALSVDLEKARGEVLKLHRADPGTPQEGGAPMPMSIAAISNNLTPHLRLALGLAREEVNALNLSRIETEHVLMGLIHLGSGTVVSVLAKFEVNEKTVRPQVEALAGPAEKYRENVPFSDLVKEALSFAAEEARNMSHTYVGTEHVLLALLRQREGGAAQIFKNLNVDTEVMRQEIMSELSGLT